MPAFSFETINVSQAGAFNAANDTLAFSASTSAASLFIIYQAPGARIELGARGVDFGSGVLGGPGVTLADGSRLFIGTTVGEAFTGTAGRDQLLGGDGADSLSGEAGDDILIGGAGADLLLGGSGDDTIQGGAGDDNLDGGDGFDVLSFNEASAAVTVTLGGAQAGDGADTRSNFEGLHGSSFADTLIGDAAGNRLSGGRGADSLDGGAGDDSLEGGVGDDVLQGGAGIDTLYFNGAGSGVVVNLETSRAISLDTVLGTDSVGGIENIVGTSFGDGLTGNDGANRLTGLAGSDTLTGGAGADTLEGAEGNDSIIGGDGDDYIIAGAGSDTMVSGVGLDTFEFAAGDSPYDGFIATIDRIRDFGGDLLLFRGGVPATAANYFEFSTIFFLDARARVQELYEQEGKEYISVQIGSQVFVFCPRLGVAVCFDGDLNAIEPINIITQLIGGGGAVSNTPTAGPDSIVGGSGADTIAGLAGNDTIDGGPGVSYLRGDDGADSLLGGDDFDDINGNMGNDTVATGGGDDFCVGGKDDDVLFGQAGNDLVYGNLGNDTCDGGEGDDIVRGGQDNDVLRGGAGNDYVSGDKGNDTVSGGAGADIFHTFGEAGIDRVLDFSIAAGDRVQMDPGTQYTLSQVGADTVINMVGGGQMILVGIQMTSLLETSIFGA